MYYQKIKGDIPVNDKFDFEIKLNGQKYTGNYYLQDSEGNYYTSENGPLKKAKIRLCVEVQLMVLFLQFLQDTQ